MYVGDMNPHTILGERGIPAFGVEIGEGGRVDEEDVACGLRGIRNVFKTVGMLPGETETLGRQRVIRTMNVIRTNRGGLLRLHVKLNETVERGQVVATVFNIFGELTEEIVAHTGGPVVRIATFPTVSSGERVVQLGVLKQ
jgi:predicted deacylase